MEGARFVFGCGLQERVLGRLGEVEATSRGLKLIDAHRITFTRKDGRRRRCIATVTLIYPG
jgi:hypothetical protein